MSSVREPIPTNDLKTKGEYFSPQDVEPMEVGSAYYLSTSTIQLGMTGKDGFYYLGIVTGTILLQKQHSTTLFKSFCSSLRLKSPVVM